MARTYMEELIYIIGHNESGNSYTSINPTDVVSIGLFNWYGARALGLARTIVAADPSGSQTALSGASTDIYGQITSGNNSAWNNFVPGQNADDMSALRRFLDLAASHTAQDELALVDGEGYASQAKSVGIEIPAAQIYYADLYNQSPRQAQNIVAAAGGGALCSLERIHQFAMENPVMNKYSTRRNWTYNELLSWVGDFGGEEPDIPVTPPVNPPSGGGNEPGVGGNVKAYILDVNKCLIHYTNDYPDGITYVSAGNNVWIPASNIPPLEVTIVGSIDEMTEHGRLYVLESNKHIYVWNGVRFMDSGVIYKG